MSCIKNLKFSPRELSSNVERESTCHKAKVVGWSAFLVMVAGSYLVTFSDLTARSTRFQNQAMAGNVVFNDYIDYSDEAFTLNYRVANDIYDKKDAKDLKYIEMGWKSQVVEDASGEKVAWGPQGDPDKEEWYTQKERATAVVGVTDPTAQQLVDQSSKAYEQWATMHDSSVVWFDTAACNLSDANKAQYGYIGRANHPRWRPTADRFYGQWFVSTEDNEYPEDDDRKANWNTDIESLDSPFFMQSTINVNDDFSMMKQNLDNFLDLADCDMDCQVKGSRLTLVATLNEASLTLLVINGLLGIWGGWSAIGRISQTYCTFLTFFFQLAILIACGTMLFTPYAKTCYSSLYPTDIGMWTMHDDYIMVITLWGTQFLWVFIFAVIGLCGAVRSEKTDDQLPK